MKYNFTIDSESEGPNCEYYLNTGKVPKEIFCPLCEKTFDFFDLITEKGYDFIWEYFYFNNTCEHLYGYTIIDARNPGDYMSLNIINDNIVYLLNIGHGFKPNIEVSINMYDVKKNGLIDNPRDNSIILHTNNMILQNNVRDYFNDEKVTEALLSIKSAKNLTSFM